MRSLRVPPPTSGTATIVITFAWILLEWAVRWRVQGQGGGWPGRGPDPLSPLAAVLILIVIQIATPMSLGVAISWITLAVVGRWKPDRGWDDRLGRLVGCLWLVYGPGETLVTALMAHWG